MIAQTMLTMRRAVAKMTGSGYRIGGSQPAEHDQQDHDEQDYAEPTAAPMVAGAVERTAADAAETPEKHEDKDHD